MPCAHIRVVAYSRKEDQAEASRRHYLQNKEVMKARARVSTKARRERFRKLLQEIKTVPCLDCGRSYPHYVMDLDHVRGQKVGNIGDLVAQGVALFKLLAEIDKCEVVCSNCHRERTHARNDAD